MFFGLKKNLCAVDNRFSTQKGLDLMNTNLAIFTPTLGAVSETFIRRHIVDLAPGRTAVIARRNNPPSDRHWEVRCPTLILEKPDFSQLGLPTFLNNFSRPFPLEIQNYLVRRFFKKYNINVVMSEYLDWSLQLFPLAKKLGIRFFAHAHGIDISLHYRIPQMRESYRLFREADGVITVNKIQKERLVNLGLDPEKVHVVPCGVEIPEVSFSKEISDSVRCVAVGRMVAKKAPILLLNAFRLVLQKYPDMTLEYIGDGPLMPSVRQFVSEFELEKNIVLHGSLPHQKTMEIMEKADIFLQHSITDPDTGDEEGMPVSILEAMAKGLPVVSTFHAGIPEAVVDRETGLLVKEGDTKAMAVATEQLILDRNLRIKLGSKARERAKRLFSAKKEVEVLRKILKIN